MGLFDFMLSPEKKIAKHVRRLTNRDAQPEDREGSAAWLAQHGTPQAILGLLSRFDMQLEHHLKDRSEQFSATSNSTEMLLTQQTVGLVSKEEYGRRKREVEEGVVEAAAAVRCSCSMPRCAAP